MWHFGPVVGNVGKTPTRSLVFDMECSFNKNDVFAFFRKADSEFPSSADLAQYGQDPRQPWKCLFSDKDVQKIGTGLFVYARAKYQDFISGKKSHETQFCRVYSGIA